MIHGRFFAISWHEESDSVCYEKMKEMRKPECREGKERKQDMRKINRTAPTAISVKRKAPAG